MRIIIAINRKTKERLVCCSDAESCDKCTAKFNPEDFDIISDVPCFHRK